MEPFCFDQGNGIKSRYYVRIVRQVGRQAGRWAREGADGHLCVLGVYKLVGSRCL